MALAGADLGGRYVLDQQIGAGGYSQVRHATDTVLRRPVSTRRSGHGVLGIYLNDHLAGATAGTELPAG